MPDKNLLKKTDVKIVKISRDNWEKLGLTMGWLVEAQQKEPAPVPRDTNVEQLLEKAWHDFEVYLCRKGLLGSRVQYRLDIENEKTKHMDAVRKIEYLYGLMGITPPIIRK